MTELTDVDKGGNECSVQDDEVSVGNGRQEPGGGHEGGRVLRDNQHYLMGYPPYYQNHLGLTLPGASRWRC